MSKCDRSTKVGGRRNKGPEAPSGSQKAKGVKNQATKSNLATRFTKSRYR